MTALIGGNNLDAVALGSNLRPTKIHSYLKELSRSRIFLLSMRLLQCAIKIEFVIVLGALVNSFSGALNGIAAFFSYR